jgi:hypothetical protein
MSVLHKKSLRLTLAALLALAATLPGTAGAYDYMTGKTSLKPTGGEMLADTLLVRPVAIVGTLLSTTAFVITLPFSALGGNVDEAAQSLVAEPFQFAFLRPLGESGAR